MMVTTSRASGSGPAGPGAATRFNAAVKAAAGGSMSTCVRRTRVLAVAVLVAGTTVLGTAPTQPAAAAVAGTSAYTAVSPTRILDSRSRTRCCPLAWAGSSFVLDVGGVAPVAAGASAVVLNVTITNPAGPGFVSAWPSDVARPTTSVINFDSPGQTIANLVTVPLDAAGRVSFFTPTGVDLIADVQGYYSPASQSSAGRFVPLTPTRVLDSRLPNPYVAGPVLPEHSVDIDFRIMGRRRRRHRRRAQRDRHRRRAGPGSWTAFAAGTSARWPATSTSPPPARRSRTR